MSEIKEKLEILQDKAASLGGLLQSIEATRAKAKAEIDGDGLTQETCRKMAERMREYHRLSRQLFLGGHLVHQDMQQFVPPDANEGQKPWPP